jgi:hypothetical protein
MTNADAENRTLTKAPSYEFSTRRFFIKDYAESVAVVAKSQAMLFGK